MSSAVNTADLDTASAYIDWKDWTGDFASLSRANSAYFDRELATLTNLGPNAAILEIGFGSGEFLAFCQARGYNVTGLEMNQLLVDHAKTKGFDARPAEALFSFDAGSFDAVIAFDVIEHIPKADIPSFLAAVRNCLKSDGRALLRFPNGDSWLGRVNQNGDPTHVSEIGYYMLDYFAGQAALEIQTFRSPMSPGFAAGVVRGLHSLFARPVAKFIAGLQHLIYLPASPVVLSTANVVAVLVKVRQREHCA